ncbi:hypothetical protein [Akkermansia muciniphila]|uniref:hypothetical protein n=1 Tax=Akkermansia muciniphila TaxID=239935 RepID=UPI000FE364E4|nr:hypothetical protein [Akkermansia muciniphila]
MSESILTTVSPSAAPLASVAMIPRTHSGPRRLPQRGKELRRYRAPYATRALLASGGTGAALSSTTVTTASGRAVLAHRTQATASCASPA